MNTLECLYCEVVTIVVVVVVCCFVQVRWRHSLGQAQQNMNSTTPLETKTEEVSHLSMPYITIATHQSSPGGILSAAMIRNGSGNSSTPETTPHHSNTASKLTTAMIRGDSTPRGVLQPHQRIVPVNPMISGENCTPEDEGGILGQPQLGNIIQATDENGTPESISIHPQQRISCNDVLEAAVVEGDITPGNTVEVNSDTSTDGVQGTVMTNVDGEQGEAVLTLENVRVAGVEAVERYNECIACNNRVVPDSTDPELGTCLQCSMMQRIDETKVVLGASLMLRVGERKFLLLRAFGIVAEFIAQKPAMEVNMKTLLKAEPFTISHRDGVILSATRHTEPTKHSHNL